MIQLLIEFLKVPMAAPETPSLKAMRFTILACCATLVPSILLLAPARAAFGDAAAGIVAGLIAVLLVLVPVYLSTKNRADEAHIRALCTEEHEA